VRAGNDPAALFRVCTLLTLHCTNVATVTAITTMHHQADLQAMDRAHRIGQTKPVRVFRFICDGTVEEKIVERADRKLFLDAAVIQQGRLAEKHAQLSKDELMTMVKFGADKILRADDTQELSNEVSTRP
jgi:SWI/SNF-related matrix-associated actin-dependent regulator of chromatin subfamily A member 5